MKRSTPADLSLICILRKRKERYSSPDGFGVLTFPGGGEGEPSTAALLGRTPPPDPLAVGDSQAAPLASTATGLGQGGDVGEDTPCLTTLLEGHLCVTLEDGKE